MSRPAEHVLIFNLENGRETLGIRFEFDVDDPRRSDYIAAVLKAMRTALVPEERRRMFQVLQADLAKSDVGDRYVEAFLDAKNRRIQ